jgi:O-antigen/teichoic acid export membrane protein
MKAVGRIINRLLTLSSSKTALNTYIVFTGNILAMFFAFFYVVILVRLLSLADFGYFSTIFTFLVVVTELSDMGIGNSLSRFIPPLKGKNMELFSFLKTAFLLQVGIVVFVLLLVILSSDFLSLLFFHDIEYSYLFKITAVSVVASIMTNFFMYVLSARQKFLHTGVITTLNGLLRLALLLVLVMISKVNLTNIIWILAFTFLILMLISFFLVGPEFLKGKYSNKKMKNLICFSLYLGAARGFTSVATRLDVLMLVTLTNAVEVGIYSIASRVIALYPLLSGSFTTVIAPRIAVMQNIKQFKTYIYKVISATVGLVFSILLLIFFSSPFLSILFGEKGDLAVPVFIWLLTAMIFFVASIPAVAVAIYYVKKPHILTINGLLQLLIVFGGNFILIPKYGKFGAAYSLNLAYCVTLLLTSFMSIYYLKKQK